MAQQLGHHLRFGAICVHTGRFYANLWEAYGDGVKRILGCFFCFVLFF